jgi:NAD(P)-dependent dehydrogenase (short-subunit alcohol dehydrogenase family)
MRLAGKVALVTGASKGIGEGIARVFVKEGARVVIADLDLETAKKTAAALGKNAVAIKCDVSKASDAKAAVELAVQKFGKLDVLVNNAGIFPFKAFLEQGEKDAAWEKTFAVNVGGVKNCSYYAAKQMARQGRGGKIISISSIAAIIGYHGLTHYCATKAAVLGFTRALAIELAPLKINVNAVCPGLIDTPGVRVGVDEKALAGIVQGIPWHRAGKSEDIAWTCVYLAAEESDFVTGQHIVVDGGNVIN